MANVRVDSALQRGKEIAQEPWCAVALLYLTYVGGAAVGKYLIDGAPVTDIIHWLWDTATAFATRPLVQLAMIPLALWMFGHGIRRIERREQIRRDLYASTSAAEIAAQDAAAQKLIDVRAETTREYREALRLPMKMAAAEFFLRELRLFDGVADQLRSQIDEYADHIKRWNADEPFDLHASESPKNPIHFLSVLGNVPPICSFQVPLRQGIAWQDAMVVRTPKEAAPPMERWGTYEPGKNRELQLALAANVKQARSIYSEWISARDVANAALDRLQREIREELSQYVRQQ